MSGTVSAKAKAHAITHAEAARILAVHVATVDRFIRGGCPDAGAQAGNPVRTQAETKVCAG